MNIAIITGASSGLGLEFYKEIQKEELDQIFIIARREDKLREHAEKFGKIPTRIIPMDITLKENIQRLQETLDSEDTNVKFLINNAGFGVYGSVMESEYSLQGAMVDLNVRALTEITSVVLKHMKENSYIINVCSIASFVPNANLTVYSSTKAYVMSFSRGLRQELKKRKINVTAICPGPMATEFLEVAGIDKGVSKMFDTLPTTKPSLVAKGSVKAAKKGRAVYTPHVLFKVYRALAKVLPRSLLIPFCKC
ncbi:MAG: SDR family NAD(P)-dependent oxidoreductase [Clostridia bacterium]|nr:SDR family NAD(P)-dependent oxidoreductase [Clostridia bacterium]